MMLEIGGNKMVPEEDTHVQRCYTERGTPTRFQGPKSNSLSGEGTIKTRKWESNSGDFSFQKTEEQKRGGKSIS